MSSSATGESNDLASLVRHANNRQIWQANLRDRFPTHTESAGRGGSVPPDDEPRPVWAIEVEGSAGGIGIECRTDVERVSAEIGYWLGQPYWGRGIATEAVRAVTDASVRRVRPDGVFALPFADNIGSIRVLEKAGFALEGHLPQSAIKDGGIRDQLMFARIASR